MKRLPKKRLVLAFLAMLFSSLGGTSAKISAQIKRPEDASGQHFGPAQTVRYRVGASITAKNGPVKDIVAMVAVPFECAEQDVQIVDEDISTDVDAVEYRLINGGARQMVIHLPYLAGRKEAHAILTFDVTTRTILPPDDALTAQLQVPDKPDRDLKRYLGRSPYIEAKSSKIRRALDDIFDDDTPESLGVEDPDNDASEEEAESNAEGAPSVELTPWQRVEKIYDHVQSTIAYEEGEDKSAVQTLKAGKGDCHDISALFVALCRTDKVPARLVWVHEHCYPEFCLADAEGNLHWFPCESSGLRAFGEMPLARVIMQKGDNFRVPERPRDHLRYASDYLIGVPERGSGKPSVRYIREQL